MNRETLVENQKVISDAFDHQTRIRNEAESEQVRLQGEYRLAEKLIASLDERDRIKNKESE